MSARRSLDQIGPNRLNRAPWLEAAEDGQFPRGLLCPHCGHELDYPVVDEVPDPTTAEAIRQAERTKRRVELEHASFSLVAVYECKSCSGKMHGLARTRYRDWDYEPSEGSGGAVEESRVLWLEPPPPLLAFPPETPDLVRNATLEAFALILHPSSCANRIRFAVELIADHFKVPRSTRTTKKNPGAKKVTTRTLSLHARIEKLGDRPRLQGGKAELLKAAKWLGNVGSHGGINTEQMLDLVEIFVLALHRIFGTHEPTIERKARDINRSKRWGSPVFVHSMTMPQSAPSRISIRTRWG